MVGQYAPYGAVLDAVAEAEVETRKRRKMNDKKQTKIMSNETSADEQRQFCEYQHKHHPDEVKYFQTHSDEKPKPAEPKFKAGDKVRIVKDITHENEYKGDVTEIIYVDRSDPDATYEVDIFDERFGGGLWYSESDLAPYTEPKFKVGDTASYVCSPTLKHKCTVTKVMQNEHSGKWEYNVMFEWGKPGMWIPESDLEPYTEPTANYVRVDYHGADIAASTIADDCQSQPMTDCHDFDRIVKDGFRGHNRLHIAAQIVAALYANYQAAKNFKSIEELVRKALDITDTLIKESEKGDSK